MQPHHRLYPDQPAVYCLASRDIDPSSVRTGSLGPPRDRHTSSISSRRRLPTERRPNLRISLSPFLLLPPHPLSPSLSLSPTSPLFFFLFFFYHAALADRRPRIDDFDSELPLIGDTVSPSKKKKKRATWPREIDSRLWVTRFSGGTIRNVSSTRQMVCGGMNEACNIGKLDTSRRARTGFWGMCVRRSGGWEVDTWDWEGNNRLWERWNDVFLGRLKLCIR